MPRPAKSIPSLPLEVARLVPTLKRERQLTKAGYRAIAGVDEAGRGPLAGPVVAAAVVLPLRFACNHVHFLNDSKQVAAEMRELLYEEIVGSVPWGVGIIEAATIDSVNILQASWLAMQAAVAQLQSKLAGTDAVMVDYVLIDGLPFGAGPWPYEAIVQGDARSLSIAAASIVAKVTRDRMMAGYDREFPHYGFGQHKGYGTAQHRAALALHGPCPLHRRSFAPVRAMLEPETADLLMTNDVGMMETTAPLFAD